MTYNYHGSWNKFVGHHSALHPRSDETGSEREWNQVRSTPITRHRFYMKTDHVNNSRIAVMKFIFCDGR